MKTCRECNVEMPLSNFYAHAKMKDGYLNKCKECVKSRVGKYVKVNPEKKKEWSRNYINSEAGKEKVKTYLSTEKGKEVRKKALESYRKNHPIRSRARYIVSYEIQCGRLVRPSICSCCGIDCKPHGHHNDYTKPIEVEWLCEPCHKKWHRKNKPVYE
jgi:hypothetical protein